MARELGREDKTIVQEPLRALGFIICVNVYSKASRMAESGVHTEARALVGVMSLNGAVTKD